MIILQILLCFWLVFSLFSVFSFYDSISRMKKIHKQIIFTVISGPVVWFILLLGLMFVMYDEMIEWFILLLGLMFVMYDEMIEWFFK